MPLAAPSLHLVIVDRHPAQLEIATEHQREALPFEEAARKLAGFDVEPRHARCIRALEQRIEKPGAHAGARRVGPAVEVIDVSVALQVSVSEDFAGAVDRDQRCPAVGSAGVGRGSILGFRRPGGDLPWRIVERAKLADGVVEELRDQRRIFCSVFPDDHALDPRALTPQKACNAATRTDL